MDITTANDQYLYRGRVVGPSPVRSRPPDRDAGANHPVGAACWLTGVAALTQGVEIEVHPTDHVLAVTGLREIATTGQQPRAHA